MTTPFSKDETPYNNSDFSPMAWAALRIVLYALAIAGAVQCLTWEAAHAPRQLLFSEESLLESLQEIFLFLTVLVCMGIAKSNPEDKALGFLLAGASAMAFIREFDFFLDSHVFDGAWQLMVITVLIIVVIALYRHRQILMPSINRFLSRPSFGVMASGFLVVFVFSRMFGRTVFWEFVMGDQYIRAVKNAAEEGTELLGYLLILVACIELFFESRRSR